MSLRETPESPREHALDEASHKGYQDAVAGLPKNNPYAGSIENFDNDITLFSIEEWKALGSAYDKAYDLNKKLKS